MPYADEHYAATSRMHSESKHRDSLFEFLRRAPQLNEGSARLLADSRLSLSRILSMSPDELTALGRMHLRDAQAMYDWLNRS